VVALISWARLSWAPLSWAPINRLLAKLRRSAYLLPTGLTAYLWQKGGDPGLPGLSCPLRALTGIPCPTCFLTRATCASLRGDLAGAIQLHAFGPPLAAGLVIWSVLAMRQRRLLPLPPPWPGVPGRGRWAQKVAGLGLALGAYWAMRLLFSFGLGLRGFPAFPTG
jgi:hypothetical protein